MHFDWLAALLQSTTRQIHYGYGIQNTLRKYNISGTKTFICKYTNVIERK
jgi:hypothetical protein